MCAFKQIQISHCHKLTKNKKLGIMKIDNKLDSVI